MSSNKNIAKAASLMLVAVLLSRVLGLVREVIIAQQFGQSGAVSAYTAAFNLPDLLYFFLSSGALSSAFIPVFTEYFQNGRQKEAWQVFSIIGSLMGIVLTIIVVIAEIYAKPLVCAFAVPGFAAQNPDLVPLTVLLTRIILPCQIFFFIGGLMMGTLEARQKFNARAAGPVIYNLGIILGAIVLGKYSGIAGLAWGTLIGAFIGNIVYTYICLRKAGFEYKFNFNLNHPGVVKVGLLALPVIFGLSLPQIDVIINKWFASWVSASSPAALNYANRLMQLPLGIFAQAAGTAILPTLSALAAKKAFGQMKGAISYGVRTIMLENIPSTVFMVIMADPIVRTVYMSKAFTSGDVPLTTIALVYYSLGIFAWAGQAIVARGFFAMQDTLTPILVGTVSTIIFIPLNLILLRSMGHGGLALATTLAVTIHFFVLTFLLKRKLGGINGGEILKSVSKVLLATAIMAVMCFGVRFACYKTLGTWQLQTGDIVGPNNLALKIADSDNNPLNKYLSPNTITEAKNFDEFNSEKTSVSILVVDKINKAILSGAVNNNDDIFAARKSSDKIFSSYLREYSNTPSWMSNLILGKEKASKLELDNRSKGLYTENDVIDIVKLCKEIENGKSHVSKLVKSEFSTSDTYKIESFIRFYKEMQGLPIDLQRDLNNAIKDKNMLANTSGNYEEVNRKYLSINYPEYVITRPFLRVESKMGSLITVLLSLIICGAVYFGVLKLLKSEEVDEIIAMLFRRKKKKVLSNDENN